MHISGRYSRDRSLYTMLGFLSAVLSVNIIFASTASEKPGWSLHIVLIGIIWLAGPPSGFSLFGERHTSPLTTRKPYSMLKASEFFERSEIKFNATASSHSGLRMQVFFKKLLGINWQTANEPYELGHLPDLGDFHYSAKYAPMPRRSPYEGANWTATWCTRTCFEPQSHGNSHGPTYSQVDVKKKPCCSSHVMFRNILYLPCHVIYLYLTSCPSPTWALDLILAYVH